jgi:hypothetical protein
MVFKNFKLLDVLDDPLRHWRNRLHQAKFKSSVAPTYVAICMYLNLFA